MAPLATADLPDGQGTATNVDTVVGTKVNEIFVLDVQAQVASQPVRPPETADDETRRGVALSRGTRLQR